jgi:hypothetical protein
VQATRRRRSSSTKKDIETRCRKPVCQKHACTKLPSQDLHKPKISKKLTSCSVWIRAAHRQKKTRKTEAENDYKESRYALGTMAMAAITKD